MERDPSIQFDEARIAGLVPPNHKVVFLGPEGWVGGTKPEHKAIYFRRRGRKWRFKDGHAEVRFFTSGTGGLMHEAEPAALTIVLTGSTVPGQTRIPWETAGSALIQFSLAGEAIVTDEVYSDATGVEDTRVVFRVTPGEYDVLPAAPWQWPPTPPALIRLLTHGEFGYVWSDRARITFTAGGEPGWPPRLTGPRAQVVLTASPGEFEILRDPRPVDIPVRVYGKRLGVEVVAIRTDLDDGHVTLGLYPGTSVHLRLQVLPRPMLGRAVSKTRTDLEALEGVMR